MAAFWSGSASEFLSTPAEALVHRLVAAHVQRFRTTEANSARVLSETIGLLAKCLCAQSAILGWRVILEYPLLRLGRRIDALVLTERAILVLEFKIGAERFAPADRRQVEDYAFDLVDFHAASRNVPVVPILVATEAAETMQSWPLIWHGVCPSVLLATGASLSRIIAEVMASVQPPRVPLDVEGWETAAYRPVPNIIEAATMLYRHHTVADIAAARAEATNLTVTTEALVAEIAAARQKNSYVALFVTGIPGAGKTLCGLNAAFAAAVGDGATFLTGNPTLVHVLREALARDEAARGESSLRLARRRMESRIQALPRFRDHYVSRPDECPAEHIAVIDEAQRSWSRAHAVAKTRDRPVRLSDSEPGHVLDIMARHRAWAVVICLVGNGQEIHDGEGGLAEWGAALASRPCWRVVAPPPLDAPSDLRHGLADLPDVAANPALHLAVSVRSLRTPLAATWVDKMLAGDHEGAAAVARAMPGAPFRLTRDLDTMRATLRRLARGTRRAGLVASAGARRLRAEGLGAELPHMDVDAVCRWFLDRWPEDVRASDALEVPASEFCCQGLELDYVGLCWGGDLVREPARPHWRVRRFRGTDWTLPRDPEFIANQINSYRVLLTRARYATIIWVPPGNPLDRTNDPEAFDAIADFLIKCGSDTLEPPPDAPLVPDLQGSYSTTDTARPTKPPAELSSSTAGRQPG